MNDKVVFFSTVFAANFWIGLYNKEQFNDSSSCGCPGSCSACRSKFEWVDDRAGTGHVIWPSNSDEPDAGEKCARLNMNNVVGTSCNSQLGYICYEGECLFKKH